MPEDGLTPELADVLTPVEEEPPRTVDAALPRTEDDVETLLTDVSDEDGVLVPE